MNLVVPDASVLLKWVLPPDHEQHVEQALALRRDIAWKKLDARVPSLWYFEVGNTLARRYPAEAGRHLENLRLFGLQESAPDPTLEQDILRLTTEFGVTFYDAAYHALAIVHEGVFVTADEKYVQAVGGEPHVMHLRDWK